MQQLAVKEHANTPILWKTISSAVIQKNQKTMQIGSISLSQKGNISPGQGPPGPQLSSKVTLDDVLYLMWCGTLIELFNDHWTTVVENEF